jgi:hypothetical protein
MKTFTLALAVVAFAASAAAQKDSATVAGRWNMNIKGPAAHGDMPATMDLAQQGSTITGTFAAHGAEHKIAGKFSDGNLTLETTDTPPDKRVEFTAKLQGDGTLSGYVSGPMGDMKWTAARAKGAGDVH